VKSEEPLNSGRTTYTLDMPTRRAGHVIETRTRALLPLDARRPLIIDYVESTVKLSRAYPAYRSSGRVTSDCIAASDRSSPGHHLPARSMFGAVACSDTDQCCASHSTLVHNRPHWTESEVRDRDWIANLDRVADAQPASPGSAPRSRSPGFGPGQTTLGTPDRQNGL
jgi:hypothetical protein